jgi:hypothetical protein
VIRKQTKIKPCYPISSHLPLVNFNKVQSNSTDISQFLRRSKASFTWQDTNKSSDHVLNGRADLVGNTCLPFKEKTRAIHEFHRLGDEMFGKMSHVILKV